MMPNYGLDYHCRILLDEYREKIPSYELLQQIVMGKMNELIATCGIELNSVEYRIKEEKSLAGKLEQKGHKYQSIDDITDLFGVRVITFYNEDVDKIASMVETLFDIDWTNSADKREMHEYNSFGYNSLHYICRLPESVYHDPAHPELNKLSFELQMRTALQHVWSAVQHDIGYKSEFEMPKEYLRNFSRLASLLELADNEFSRTRAAIYDYRRRMQSLLQNGKLEEVELDGDSFRSYLSTRPFDKLNKKIASINHAEIHHASCFHYLQALRKIGIKTLRDIESMISDNFDDAYQLALYQLGNTDIDIISETIGIQNLCIVYILKSGGTIDDIQTLFDLINGESNQHAIMAQFIIEQANRLSFMHK